MRLIAPLLLVACAGEADKSDTGETDGTPATFVEVRDEVLVPSCGFGSCHGAAAGGRRAKAEKRCGPRWRSSDSRVSADMFLIFS